MRKRSGIWLVLLAVLALSACKKKEAATIDNESQSVVDFSLITNEFIAIVTNVHNAEWNTRGLGFYKKTDSCDSLSKINGDTLWSSAAHIAPTYTIGPRAGCNRVFADGVARTGQVEVNISNRIDQLNTIQRLKLRDYTFDGYTLSCDSMVITTFSLGHPIAYNRLYVNIYNGVCRSGTVSISCDLTLICTCLYGNTNSVNGFFRGTATGKNRLNGRFAVSILDFGLNRSITCRYITKGKLEITPEGLSPRMVDYGYGTCDDYATFSVKDDIIAFKLK